MCYSALVRKDMKEMQDVLGYTLTEAMYHDRFYKHVKKDTELNSRIFPGSFAPIVYQQNEIKFVELMRYGVFPPVNLEGQKKFDLVFNARKDNLDSKFWADSFSINHGVVIVKSFYEWVAVKSLLKAGVITILQVKEEFEKQALDRKTKIEATGKKWKPTATELKDPRFRQIIIEFKPRTGIDLVVPVIFNSRTLENGVIAKGFAMVTDEPSEDIKKAGHDRSPVFLKAENISNWIKPGSHTSKDLLDFLEADTLVFDHRLQVGL